MEQVKTRLENLKKIKTSHFLKLDETDSLSVKTALIDNIKEIESQIRTLEWILED